MRRFAAALALMATTGTAQAACRDDAVLLTGDFGQASFAVTVADDPAERAQGLMNVEDMPRMTGMLFVYEGPQIASFWMRNTLIPLDMIFADEDGVVQHIHAEAIPLDETPILGGDDIKYVLEVNGGMADRLGLSPGDVMQHPAIGPDPAMPCVS
ncbi:hypothetical protein SAMN04488003_101201 [Loktanella fryxellensis]|uniref:DUF192 domain-containing protein n=1 Tax=Loktanella fryxellensis TaxID=245187 RepID=A0A1H7YJ73_9RHOB|nr:DUF192 domain-containing protein [Loktanella fryxellensis]SEM46286.1 hypothetical protein SAMN04488003_101201 [Loktanella fryxellensis]